MKLHYKEGRQWLSDLLLQRLEYLCKKLRSAYVCEVQVPITLRLLLPFVPSGSPQAVQQLHAAPLCLSCMEKS